MSEQNRNSCRRSRLRSRGIGILALSAVAIAIWLACHEAPPELSPEPTDHRDAVEVNGGSAEEAGRIPITSPVCPLDVEISMPGQILARRQPVSVSGPDGFGVMRLRTDKKGRIELRVPPGLTVLRITAEFLRSRETVEVTIQRSAGRATCAPVVFGFGKTGVVIEIANSNAVPGARCGVRGFRGRTMTALRLFDSHHLDATGGQAIAELDDVDSLVVYAGVGATYNKRVRRDRPSGWQSVRFDLGSLRLEKIELGGIPFVCRARQPVLLHRRDSNEQRLVFTDDLGFFELVDDAERQRELGPWFAELKLDSGESVALRTRNRDHSVGLGDSIVFPGEDLVAIRLLGSDGKPEDTMEWRVLGVTEGGGSDSPSLRTSSSRGPKLVRRLELTRRLFEITMRSGQQWRIARGAFVPVDRGVLGIEIPTVSNTGELSLVIRGDYDRRFGLAVAAVKAGAGRDSAPFALVQPDPLGGVARVRGLSSGHYDLYWAKVRSTQVDPCGQSFLAIDITAGSKLHRAIEMPVLRRRPGRFRGWAEMPRGVRPNLIRLGGVTRTIDADGFFEMDTIGEPGVVGDLWFPRRMGWVGGSVRLVAERNDAIEVQVAPDAIHPFELEFSGRSRGFVAVTGWVFGAGNRIRVNATARSDGSVSIAGAANEVLAGYVRSFVPGEGSGAVLAFFELRSGDDRVEAIRVVGCRAVDVRLDGLPSGSACSIALEWVSPGGRKVTCDLGHARDPIRIVIPEVSLTLRVRSNSEERAVQITAAAKRARFNFGGR